MRKAFAVLALVTGTIGLGLIAPAAQSGATGPTTLTSAYIEDNNSTNVFTATQFATVTAQNSGTSLTVNWSSATTSGKVAIAGPFQVGQQNAPSIVANEGSDGCAGPNGQTFFELDQLVMNGSNVQTLAFQFDCFDQPQNVEISGTIAINAMPTTPHAGYYMYGDDGSLAGFGNDSYLNYLGDLTTVDLNQPIVGMATTPDDAGYWMVATDGGIFSFGDAPYYGSTGNIHLNQPIVGMAATPSGKGYWFVAADGGVFSFGDAQFFGSTGAIHLNQPIVGMAATPDGQGYWLVATDGGIFAFGDAQFFGSTGAFALNRPIVGMAPTPTGQGYWLVASDGGIFTFGDGRFFGSAGATHLNQPIVGIQPTEDGGGYWMVAADGGIFTFGDATFQGSLGGQGITNVMGLVS